MKNTMLILSLMLLIFGCENIAVEPEIGTVAGKVTISPLCGTVTETATNANPCGFTDQQLNDIYGKYKVFIKGEVDGKAVSKIMTLDKTGLFSFEIPVGTYDVEVVLPDDSPYLKAFNGTSNLAKGITVKKSLVTKLDLYVGTGFR